MKRIIIFLTAVLLALAPVCWFFPEIRSYAVMGVYSALQNDTSVMRENGFEISLASGKGWYPVMLTYNDIGFSDWSGIDAKMSILYSFGAFDAEARASTLYDRESGKYASFYGAYAAQKADDPFGFLDDNSLDTDEVIKAVAYDYTQLVIRGFGFSDPVFSADEYTVEEDVTYAGSAGWTRIDAQITTNGTAHNFSRDQLAYLQYGRPAQKTGGDFEVTEIAGRVYAKYFEEYGCTVMLYVMAPDFSEVEACDEEILCKTVISGL